MLRHQVLSVGLCHVKWSGFAISRTCHRRSGPMFKKYGMLSQSHWSSSCAFSRARSSLYRRVITSITLARWASILAFSALSFSLIFFSFSLQRCRFSRALSLKYISDSIYSLKSFLSALLTPSRLTACPVLTNGSGDELFFRR